MKRVKFAMLTLMIFALVVASVPRQVYASQPLFSNNMFSATPQSLSISFDTPFTVNVTNKLNDSSLWVFCLAQENITRVDAPTFYTMAPNETYQYKFVSPNVTDVNSTATLGGYGNATIYEIYFGAVNEQATSFQTSVIVLQMTTVASLNAMLQQLLYQNGQLQAQVATLIEKASFNNLLVIGIVVSNVLWPCAIIYMRLSGKKQSSVTLSPQQSEETETT